MSATHPLDQPIEGWSLLQSKFYQAWSRGTLPVGALRSYACQYGSFISAVPPGWEAQGDHKVAEVEKDHIEMWRRFAATLGTEIGAPTNEGVARLVTTACRLFANPVESIGALYAFEAQQPGTAESKLAGLREHYEVDRGGEEYFEVHKDDDEEPQLLRDRFDALSGGEKRSALAACSTMSRALRGALDSLYEEEVSSQSISPFGT